MPLSIKNVKPLNITAVLALPAHDPEALAFLERLAPYLWDPALYTASVPAEPKLLSTAFTSEEERLMFNHKFHLHNGPVRGCVYGFKAAQYFKGCTRPVWDCRIKEAFTDILPHYHLQTQTAISKQLHAIASSTFETIFVQFDFAAFYDQFALAPDVSASFCFKDRTDQTCSLTRLPMGFTLACAIAQATTWQLLNFDRRSSVFTCIDNVAFAGSVSCVTHDVLLFLERCLSVSATLNDHSADSLRAVIASPPPLQQQTICSWHSEVFCFLGVRYDWRTTSKSLAPKTLIKLAAARDCLNHINDTILPRQLAAVIGLLRHANSTLELPGYEHHTTLRWTASVASLLQRDLVLWDSVYIKLPIEHKVHLLNWFTTILTPRDVPIHRPLPVQQPTTIIVDASATGWGGILLENETLATAAGTWPAGIQSSVLAEPEGVWQAVSQLLPHAPETVLVITDHLPLVFASMSLFPRAAPYNSLLLRLKQKYPSTRFIFSHVAGTLNLADSLSRGVSADITLEKVQA